MSTRSCRECDGPVGRTANFCPHCGARAADATESLGIGILIAVVAVLFPALVLGWLVATVNGWLGG